MNELKLAESDRITISNEASKYHAHLHFPEYLRIYEEGLNRTTMQDNAIRRPRFFNLIQMFKLTRGVPGVTAEAGVFRGLSSYLLCHYLRRENSLFNGETHYMIDSFEGLSRPVEKDGEYPAKRHGEGAFTHTSVEFVQNTMKEFPGANILKGWIPEVFDRLPEQRYRFVHIDVDVYEPTLAGLRYFYPRLSPGGILVCDDFGPWDDNNWPGCIRAVNEYSNESGVVYSSLDTGNAVFIKR